MTIRAYGIINDTDNDVLVMGTKREGYLQGFLVFFGGRVEDGESSIGEGLDARVRLEQIAEPADRGATLGPLEVVEAHVGRDAVEPGAPRRTAFELRSSPPGSLERLLHEILGEVHGSRHPIAVDLEFTPVTADDRLE